MEKTDIYLRIKKIRDRMQEIDRLLAELNVMTINAKELKEGKSAKPVQEWFKKMGIEKYRILSWILVFISGIAFTNLFWLIRFGSYFNDLIGIRMSNFIFIVELFSFFVPLLVIYYLNKKEVKFDSDDKT